MIFFLICSLKIMDQKIAWACFRNRNTQSGLTLIYVVSKEYSGSLVNQKSNFVDNRLLCYPTLWQLQLL